MSESFFMIGCEVGTAGSGEDRPLAIGKFIDSNNYQMKLTKPGKFGTVESILNEYGVQTSTFPKYLKDALQLEATIQQLEYESKGFLVTRGAGDVIQADASSLPASLTGAIIKSDTSGNTVTLEKDGQQLTDYKASMTAENKYLVVKGSYTFAVVAQYKDAFEIVPKLLAIKFLAFAITNDDALKGKQNALEALVAPALSSSVAARVVGGVQEPKPLPA